MKQPDKAMRDLQRLLKTQDFKDEKQLNEFLSKMIGQTIPEFDEVALSNEEKAEDLISEAYQLDEEKGLVNAIEALELDPDCIMAFEFLGSMQVVPHFAMAYYAYGIELGRKKFVKELKNDRGHFWGIYETRPFMQCLNSYASCLFTMRREERAFEIYREILELNERDNMGVRNHFSLYLIWKEMYGEYLELDKKFGYETNTIPGFNRLLYTYRIKGDCEETRELLKDAKANNPHVVKILTAKVISDMIPASFELGSKDEAIFYAGYAYHIWSDVDGAIDFLKKNRK